MSKGKWKALNVPRPAPMTMRLRLMVAGAAFVILGYPNPASMLIGAALLIASRAANRHDPPTP